MSCVDEGYSMPDVALNPYARRFEDPIAPEYECL